MSRASTVLAALLIGLSAVSAVSAGHGHGKSQRHRSKQHQTDPLLALAHDVSAITGSVHRLAERTAHHRSHHEGLALGRLHELDLLARDFRKDLEHYGPLDSHVRHEYFELRRSMDRARYAVRRMHALRPVVREFARLDELMRELDYVYGVRLAMLRHTGHRDDDRHRHGVVYHDDDRQTGGYVRIGTRWDGKAASIGFGWGD